VDKFIEIHGEPSGSLVDLCCGTGNIANNFKSRFNNLSVVGYDISAEMLSYANYKNISFVNKPIEFIDEKYDNIVCNNAYHHFDNLANFWKIIDKISNEKSKILISDVVRPDDESKVDKIVTSILGENSKFNESFTLSLKSSYTEKELNDHKGINNLLIIDTPVEHYKLFFIYK
jgi:SAM-dependent methyltransferase